jgi:hypothetical protein
MATVTSKNKAEHDEAFMAKRSGMGMKEDEVVGTMSKTHSPKKEIDIGQGRYVHRHGFDANGNHAVYVAQGSGKAKKIQTVQNLPTVHRTRPDLTEAGIREIHAYADKYHKDEE